MGEAKAKQAYIMSSGGLMSLRFTGSSMASVINTEKILAVIFGELSLYIAVS